MHDPVRSELRAGLPTAGAAVRSAAGTQGVRAGSFEKIASETKQSGARARCYKVNPETGQREEAAIPTDFSNRFMWGEDKTR